MATRATLIEAQELKAQLEAKYNLKLKIVSNIFGEFDVLEIKVCRCGAEVLSAAIGEDDFTQCNECYRRREARQAQVLERGIENSAQRVAEHVAFDENSEFWK